MTFGEQIKIMKEGGEILASILKTLKNKVYVGKKASELNELAEKLILKNNAEPAFKNYNPPFSKGKPYPYSLCVSINDVIVHGYPTENLIIKDGDIVKLDLGIKFKNYFTDAAITVGAGNITAENKKAKSLSFGAENDKSFSALILATKNALVNAIKVAKAGNTFGDIGFEIEKTITSAGFKPIKDLCGHDIGEFIHGDLQILNFGDPGTGEKIKPGMFFTIEPMASISSEYSKNIDNFIFKTKDGSVSAHFETTLAIAENEAIVLVPIFDE